MEMLVSTEWLAGELGAPDLVILDASLHLPGAGRNAADDFAGAHVPGAQFLDLASLHDPSSAMPGKIPDAEKLEARLIELGVTRHSRIILYDDSDLRTACRAWFLLRVFGFEALAVLDGGLKKWRSEERGLSTSTPNSTPGTSIGLKPRTGLLRDKQAMLRLCKAGTEQIVDARDAERFAGTVEDHVHGLPGGHIPGSCNLPFTRLLAEDGTFRPKQELQALFEQAGINLSRPIVTTCGSGVTASVLTFALHWIGVDTVALYDGSWSEWGADPNTPKETGAAR